MNRDKNRINLIKDKIDYLKSKKHTGIKNKYAQLILNVIIANNNLPIELKDCILDHNMLESLMLDSDYIFLISEFGKDLSEFPIEFQVACKDLKNEFQIDYSHACLIDYSIKNKVYGKNYKSVRQYFYYQEQYESVRSQIRELIIYFISELGIVANLPKYDVFASCVVFGDKFKLRLEIYVREINNYPSIFESKEFPNSIDLVNLKKIEHYYEWLAIAQKWGNEIDLDYIFSSGKEIQSLIPDLNLVYPIFNKLD